MCFEPVAKAGPLCNTLYGAVARGNVDSFSYLSVLLSIIIGLAVTQILQGLRVLMLSRASARLYAPSLIWSALLLLIATQMWW